MAEELNRKDVEEIRNLRQAETEITKELVSLREKLTTLSKADVLNLSEAANIQSRILTLEKEKQGIQSDIVDLSGNALQTDERRAKIAEDQTKRLIQQRETTGDILIHNQKIEASDKIQSAYQREFVTKAAVISKQRADGVKDNESINKSQKVYNDTVGELQALRKQDEKSYVQLNDLAKRVLETTISEVDNILDKDAAQKAASEGKFIELRIEKELYELQNSEYDLAESKKEILQKVNQISTATDDKTREALTEELKFLQMKDKLLNREFINYSNIIAEKEELNAINKKEADAQAQILEDTKNLKDTIDSTGIGVIFDGIEGQIAKIPGGKALTQAFGFDKMKESINTNLGDSFKNVVSGFQQGGAAGFKALIGGVQSFGKALMVGPQAAIFALLAAVTLLVGMFGEVDKAISEVQKTLGGSKEEAFKTYEAAQGMSHEMGIVGIHAQEIVKGMSTVSEIMGGIDVATQIKSGNKELEQFAKDATILSEKFAMSTEEIGNIKALATLTGESMGSLVQKSQGLGKGLMTDKAAMQALASVPKSVAVAFKGGTESLIKAAQKAKMLGMDLSKVQEIGDGMLDIESSLAKEMEARVLTGKNLNLDTARQLALQGDIAGLQDEILNQAGSLSEFQDMNRLQQKSMAEAMGMSVDEMTNMLTKAQEARDIGLDSAKIDELQKMNQEDLAKTIASTNNAKQKAYLQNLAAEKESATLQEKITDSMTKLKEQAMKIIAPLLEMATVLFDSLMAGDSLGDTMDMVGSSVTAIVPIIKSVFGFVSSIGSGLMSVFGFMSNIGASTVQAKDAAGNLTGQVETVKSSFGGILSVVMAIGAAFAGKALIGKGLDLAKDKAMDLGKTLMDNVGGAASKVAGKMGGLASKVTGKMGGLASKVTGKMGGLTSKMGKVAGGASKAAGDAKGGSPLASLAESMQDLDGKKLMQIAAAILIFAAALYVAAKGFQEMGKVDWKKAYVGVLIFSAMVGALIVTAMLLKDPVTLTVLGVLAAVMVALGAALLLAAVGFKIMGEVNWDGFKGMGMALVELAAGFTVLGAASVFIILGAAAMMVMGAAAAVFGAGLYVIANALAEFAKIGDFGKVGEDLAAGMTAIGSISDKVDLGKLEDSFDDLEDALEELDFEQLAAFGQLGNSSLKGAGDNLVAGMNSLMGINQSINWSGLEDTFDYLEDALDELDLDGITAFAKLGEEGIKNAGANIMAGLNSFQGIDPKAAIAAMAPLEDVFSTLEDVFDELDYEDLDAFGKVDFSKLATNTNGLVQFAQALGNIGSMSGMDKLEEQFEKLSDAIDELDIDKLNELSNLKPEAMGNLGKLQGVSTVQQTTTTANPTPTTDAGGGGAGAATSGANMSGIEKKLDQLISVITAAVSQPTIIKFGDRFIEEIKSTIDMKKSYQAENNYGRKA